MYNIDTGNTKPRCKRNVTFFYIQTSPNYMYNVLLSIDFIYSVFYEFYV